jgi:hypothetical protein
MQMEVNQKDNVCACMLYNFALEDALTFVDFVLASIIIW